MLYWKEFLLMCIASFVFTLAGLALIVLGIFKVIPLTTGLWIVLVFIELACIMASIVCWWLLRAEVQERRANRDNK